MAPYLVDLLAKLSRFTKLFSHNMAISVILNDFFSHFKEILSWAKGRNKVIIVSALQVNIYEILVNFFLISHNLTLYSPIVHKFTRIYPVCSTYELTKQFM